MMMRAFLTSVIWVVPLAGLAACSTTPEPASAPKAVNPTPKSADRAAIPETSLSSLGPQTLAPGECGLFGWDRSEAPRFVFFSTTTTALYVTGEGPVRTLPIDGDFPAKNYGPIELELGPSEPMIDGLRYPQARITERQDDGFSRRQPLVILQTCQKLAADKG